MPQLRKSRLYWLVGDRRNVKILRNTPSIIRTNRLVIRRGKFWHSQSGTSFVHRFLASPSEARPQPLKVSWLATILLWYTFSNHHQNRRTAREAEAEEVNNRSRSHSPLVVGVNAPRTESFCRRRGAREKWLPVEISRNGDEMVRLSA